MPDMRQIMARRILAAILTIECIGGVFLLVGMGATFPDPGPDQQVLVPIWFGLLVSVIVGIVWIGATLFGVLRTRGNWVRASSVVLHILMFAVGAGILQGIIGTPLFGSGLIILAVSGFVTALMLRPAATELQTDSDAE